MPQSSGNGQSVTPIITHVHDAKYAEKGKSISAYETHENSCAENQFAYFRLRATAMLGGNPQPRRCLLIPYARRLCPPTIEEKPVHLTAYIFPLLPDSGGKEFYGLFFRLGLLSGTRASSREYCKQRWR